MHEVSLGEYLRDYLTGEQIENTTYEDLRQSLARIFVEDLGYSRENLSSKIPISFDINGDSFERTLDIIIYNDTKTPLLAVLFCAGQVNTFKREGLAMARLIKDGPARFLVITDTKTAALYDVRTSVMLKEGMQALPKKDELEKMLTTENSFILSETDKTMEQRILYAYSQFQKTCCEECISVE